jgi:adenylate cyclase
MWLLAQGQRRGEALAHYETCRRVLAEELGVEPAAATERLYEGIRDGTLEVPVAPPVRPRPSAEPPAFLSEDELVAEASPVFVGRERELARLDGFLDLAHAGDGCLAFVAGEAGSGKTFLLEEFARRAQNLRADLVVAGGRGVAYTGVGDPYLPFREVLALLTGDVQARYAAGAIGAEKARRLWRSLPHTVQAIVEAGPDLVDTLVSGPGLLGRALAYQPGGAEWLTQLEDLLEVKAQSPTSKDSRQADLFEQYSQMLCNLASRAPLLVLLDDLQWADHGSIDLLFHLGLRVPGSRILIVGAYRPEDIAAAVAAGRRAVGTDSGQTGHHPLEPVLHEFRRQYGDITIEVGGDEGSGFVEALVDAEPNRLGARFREMLHRQTRGHALFTVELLRGMQERGDLIHDEEGRWTEGPTLDWDTLPPRVEGVIGQRIGRLPEPWQHALRAASVQGEVFSAEVLARVQGVDERELVQRLSGDLSRVHRLVKADSLERVGAQSLSHYRFRHFLFQRYLYNSLDVVSRPRLHQATGSALEELYGDQAENVAVQLAHHYQQAGVAAKAAEHLYHAGIQCTRRWAYQEAIAHFTDGLELLESSPDTPERMQMELALLCELGTPLVTTKGSGSPELGRAMGRALELVQRLGETDETALVRTAHLAYYLARADHHTALRLARQRADAAERCGDRQAFPIDRLHLSLPLFLVGDFEAARAHARVAVASYDRERDFPLAVIHGQDLGQFSLHHLAYCLWCLGFPDRALELSREAVALAQSLDHPYSRASALTLAGCLRAWSRCTPEEAIASAEAAIEVTRRYGFVFYDTYARGVRGWGIVCQGAIDKGETELRRGLAAWVANGNEWHKGEWLSWLAEACVKMGRTDEALDLLVEALAFVERTDERYYEAEIRRLYGEVLLQQGNEAEAKASYRAAIEVARQQQARSWELRATTSLSRLLQRQGKREEAHDMLAEIYGWFTEGFGTADLIEAKELLAEFAGDT